MTDPAFASMPDVPAEIAQEMAEGAAEWFGSLGKGWPTESVADVARQNNANMVKDASYRTPAYYGVAAVLLMLVAAHGGEWPPLSPSSFSRGLTRPKMVKEIARYAKNIAFVELPQHG